MTIIAIFWFMIAFGGWFEPYIWAYIHIWMHRNHIFLPSCLSLFPNRLNIKLKTISVLILIKHMIILILWVVLCLYPLLGDGDIMFLGCLPVCLYESHQCNNSRMLISPEGQWSNVYEYEWIWICFISPEKNPKIYTKLILSSWGLEGVNTCLS